MTLLLMVLMLADVNVKSLIYLSKNLVGLDVIFHVEGIDNTAGVIGAFAFSMVTVLIMRLGDNNNLKLIFPFFDFALVFCGYNLDSTESIFNDPIRFLMTIFIALFAAFTTYSLGHINADQHSEANTESKIKLLEENIKLLQGKLELAESTINKQQQDILLYKPKYIQSERGRILKKQEKNRTPEDLKILKEYEMIYS